MSLIVYLIPDNLYNLYNFEAKMKFIQNFFRNYLHRRNFKNLQEEKWLKILESFFQEQGLNLKQLKCETLSDILMLQSVFNSKFLRIYSGKEGNFYPFFYFGNFLVSQSFLSENPAEKVWKINAEKAKFTNYPLREFNKKRASLGKIYNFGDSSIPKIISVFLPLIFLLIFSSLFSIITFNQKKLFLNNSGFRTLKIVNIAFAGSRNKNIDYINNLFTEEKIVSSSANRLIKN